MKMTDFGDTSHAAIACAVGERFPFGPGAYMAPILASVQGTSVPGAAERQRTFAIAVPTAVNDGGASGHRLGSPPV